MRHIHDGLRALTLLALAAILGLADTASAQPFGGGPPVVEVSARIDRSQAAPGSHAVVAIVLDHAPGWHVWTNERELPDGYATFEYATFTRITAEIDGAGSVTAAPDAIRWPEIHKALADVGDGPQEFAVFSGRAVAYLPIVVGADAAPGPRSIAVTVHFQACDESQCLMPTSETRTVALEVVASDATPAAPARDGDFAALPEDFGRDLDVATAPPTAGGTAPGDAPTGDGDAAPARAPATEGSSFFGFKVPRPDTAGGIVIVSLLAALGGFILNLTPCVLPVLPIKVLTISQHAGSPGRSLVLGLWMAAGVVAFWIGIGLPVALFSSVTDPSRIFGIWWVTLGIGLLIGAMGVGIMGLFTLNLPTGVYMINPKADSAGGSFMFGVMTAVLGLPCFGFVAGALLAGSATLPAATILAIFASIGIGMAAPYLVLAARPSLVDRLPRTGPASDLVKQVMGLLLLAAAAYFVGSGLVALVNERPYLDRQLHWWTIAIIASIAGVWLVVRTWQITPKLGRRLFFGAVGVFMGAIAILYAADSTGKARATWEERQAALADSDAGYSTKVWNDFTPRAFDKARADGRVVVLDFTAEWCLNCKALKATVLNRDPVKSAIAADDVVAFTVDLTSTKAPGWDMLRSLGQTGIPLLVIYTPGNGEPWQSNAYTPAQVMDALGGARGLAAAVPAR